MITVQRIDGTAAAFEAADVLRVHFSTVPLARDKTLAVAIDVFGEDSPIYTRERFDKIVCRLESKVAMIEFTDPNGNVVAINAARVSDIQPNGRQEPGDARTILVIGGLRQAVREPKVTAVALLGYTNG